ncbi:TetR/AcrR family transcriptional regulator C-terminal domain-containing protein [Anaeromicropila herbilytica]|uniref:TetR family transcriptional regulator n=1 Tax=Anaeromicropila herbilytica TaxID=2785025 RepID=A0A7R7IBT5_9FIRM|nr:TetR/AcrR family transcriptional regulator C-terminal domain-containing protein [Anaeromicropila herbilytica]BCN29179.1 TetR family transcriptional regulator [Anaeromicropila herbilytica]
MQHVTTSLMTKKALAESFKKILEQKPLGKISVREIIEDCGVNRKTFYYHFENVYDLLQWIFKEEAIEIVKQYDLIVDYQDAINFMLNYLENNKHICNCVFDALGRDELKRFFQEDFFSIIGNTVYQLAEGKKIPRDYLDFLINFYTEALASLLIDWIRNKENESQKKMIQYISFTLYETINQVITKAELEFN